MSSLGVISRIEELQKCLDGVVNGIENESSENYLLKPVDLLKFSTYSGLLGTLASSDCSDFEANIEENEAIDENGHKHERLLEDIRIFNEGLKEKTTDFILLMSFQSLIQEYLDKLVDAYKQRTNNSEDNSQHNSVTFGEYKVPEQEFKLLNYMCILLDLKGFWVVRSYPSSKMNFYRMIGQIMGSLYNLDTRIVETFWVYLESREALIKDTILDRQSTGERIAWLEICNSLSDKYYLNNIQGKKDSNKKDSMNDRFHFRVRIFLANILNFEDNTGLNKYFHSSNRITHEVSVDSRKQDSEFLRAIMRLNKLFREPYYYLKPANHKLLNRIADTLKQVFEYLISEEVNALKKKPKTDPFAVLPQKSKEEEQYLGEKYSRKLYFPEEYLLSPFDNRKKGEKYEQTKKEDCDFISKLFDESKSRQIILVQIYFICHFYYEINSENRKSFLKSLNAPSNVKHITEDCPPNSLVSLFLKIKKEILKRYRSIDSQFSFLLQHMAIEETYWWSWLIYGKDPHSNKSLFADKELSLGRLQQVDKKRTDILPFKERRYFNNYITPQLSRRMKVERNLQSLTKATDDDYSGEHDQKIDELKVQIDSSQDLQQRKQLASQRNALLWKTLKKSTNTTWLTIGQEVTKDVLDYWKIEKPSKDSTQREEPPEGQDQEVNQENALPAEENLPQDSENDLLPKKRSLESDDAKEPETKKEKLEGEAEK